MSSIYERAMGPDFRRLHPKIRRRFGFDSQDGVAAIGTGVMEELWHGAPYVLPFLRLGARRNIMFPCRGRDVPFRIENYAYRDRFGRETVTWIRTFDLPDGPRRFDATMIYSEGRRRIVDYLGTHQHLAVDIHLRAASNGGLALDSGSQRVYEGGAGFRFPMIFSGDARVCEWYDEQDGRFRIEVSVRNPFWGPLFGYRGWFTVEWKRCEAGELPSHVKPMREEFRE
jgi:Domain of unknown function (DUF4166)